MLAGAWVPVRKGEWKARVIGIPHAARAAMPHTKMVYDSTGNGKGWVGDVHVKVKVHTLARNQFSTTAKSMFWSGSDGNLTLHGDGTLEVRYPSSGILEYWKRSGGATHAQAAKKPVETPTNASFAAARSSPARRIKIVFRRVDKLGIGWHWALALGDSIWEVAGVPMAIVGPRGVVVGIPYPGHKGASSGARLSHYDGYIQMQGTSRKTDDEIDKFSRDWASRHPLYNAYGPNCQTFTEDLFIYLTGQNLGFAKFADLQSGPEKSAEAVWLNPSKKPW